MLQIHVLPLGDYQTNCYILHNDDSSDCVVLDPGYEPEIILSYLAEKKQNLTAIALTHCHFDHVGAVKELAAQTDCRVYLNHVPSLIDSRQATRWPGSTSCSGISRCVHASVQ